MTNQDTIYGEVIRALRDYDNAKRRLTEAAGMLKLLASTSPSSWIQPEKGCREAALKEYDDAKKALEELG